MVKGFKVFKRTFQAKKFARGSSRRKMLNKSGRTSEFVPSDKFGFTSVQKNSLGRPMFSGSFKTKKETEKFLKDLNKSSFKTASQRGIKRKRKGGFPSDAFPRQTDGMSLR